ncbi:hypothetical protein MACK_002213 [Theileria orientalis]|uniref:Guanylate cyclase domain-containing protein n=1 Tax=Theileria orientalis TaxID=68886 RepID=A0A976QU47_THEOR|nr:hypothetical protein MACK_002213 [Theileria orientalis]
MHIIKRCPCINKDLADYFSSDDDEEELFESDIYDKVKNDWEWLSLRHERRLNEVLNLVKHSRNADNRINNINLSTFLSFTPKLLQNHLHRILVTYTEWNGRSLDDKPFESIFDGNAAVMFCDISGFTRLVELIETSEDLESVSNLGQFLNNFFDPLINLIHFYKGDIIKFSGDALLSIFYPLHGSGSDYYAEPLKGKASATKSGKSVDKVDDSAEDSGSLASELRNLAKKLGKDHLETYIHSPVDEEDVDPAEATRAEKEACINCLKCCRDLHNILNNYPMPLSSSSARKDENNKIKLHIGCSYGRIKMKCVGGIFERYEYYLTGDPLNDLSILGMISKSDQTLLSDQFYKKVEKDIKVQHIEHNKITYYEFISMNEDEPSNKVVRNDEVSGLYERETSIDDESSDDETFTGDEATLRVDKVYPRRMNESKLWRDEMRNLNNYYGYISQESARHKYLLQKDKEEYIQSRFHSKELSELLKREGADSGENNNPEERSDDKEHVTSDNGENDPQGTGNRDDFYKRQDSPLIREDYQHQESAVKKNEVDQEKERTEKFKQRYIKILSSFMPRYIYNKLVHGFNIHNNEMRKITIVFANFEFLKPMRRNKSTWNNEYIHEAVKGVARESMDMKSKMGQPKDLGTDGNVGETIRDNDEQYNNSAREGTRMEGEPWEQSFLSEEEVERKINVIMKICQKACYSFEGSINKLLLDDKGLTILMIMGFPPLFHEDDALRAIFCGLKIAKDTKKIDVNVGIGVTTGRVWCGTLGNDIRKEYTALGDIVNISSRLMSSAVKLSSKNTGTTHSTTTSDADSSRTDNVMKTGAGGSTLGNMKDLYNILVDDNTYNECRDYIELLELEPIKLKGKSDMFKVYTPTGRLYNNPKTHIFDDINMKNANDNLGIASGGSSIFDRTNVATLSVHSSNGIIPGLNNAKARRVLDELYNINQVGLSILNRVNNLRGKTLFINCNDSNNNQLTFYYINHLLSEVVNSGFCEDDATGAYGDDDTASGVGGGGTFGENMDKLKRLYSKHKILNINHNKHNKLIYSDLEDAYKLLILDIVNIWSNSTTRSDYYVVNSGNENKCGNDKKSIGNYRGVSEDGYNGEEDTNKQFEVKLLKELLDPKLHWNLNILNKVISNLKHNNHLLTLLFNNRTRGNNSVLKHLYNSLSGATSVDNISTGTSNMSSNVRGGRYGSSTYYANNTDNIIDNETNDASSDLLEEELEEKLLLLVEKERLNVSEYIYSLIEGINLHYPIILVVNASHDKPTIEDNRLISKLLKRSCEHEKESCTRESGLCEYDKKELILVVINFNRPPEASQPLHRTHTTNFNFPIHSYHQTDSSINSNNVVNQGEYANEENTINIESLTKSQIRTLLSNLLSSEEFGASKLTNTDELVDSIYNTTNGLYYFTFKYFNYLLNSESSCLDEESHDDGESSGVVDAVRDNKWFLGHLDREIGNYFKYKLDQLEPRELFALKILILLDKPITERQLSIIMNSNQYVGGMGSKEIVGGLSSIESVWGSELASFREGHQDSIVSSERKDEKEQIMKKLTAFNLVIPQEGSPTSGADDDADGSGTPAGLGDKTDGVAGEVKYYVNNRLVRKIIHDRILDEEKSHIINDYLVNHFVTRNLNINVPLASFLLVHSNALNHIIAQLAKMKTGIIANQIEETLVSNRLESTSRSFLKPLITDSRNRKIKKICSSRKINLIYSPVILKRYKTNKTTFKNSRIMWTIEWSFLKHQLNFIDHNFDEHSTLEECYTTLRSNLFKSNDYRNLCNEYNLEDVFILLRHLPAKSNSYRYYKCNPKDSILKNLENLTVSDFPTFYVISKNDIQSYEMYVYTPSNSPRIEKTPKEASKDPGNSGSKDSRKGKD